MISLKGEAKGRKKGKKTDEEEQSSYFPTSLAGRGKGRLVLDLGMFPV